VEGKHVAPQVRQLRQKPHDWLLFVHLAKQENEVIAKPVQVVQAALEAKTRLMDSPHSTGFTIALFSVILILLFFPTVLVYCDHFNLGWFVAMATSEGISLDFQGDSIYQRAFVY